MDISIIIVNYKSKEKTFKCLDSIRNSVLDGISIEVIVVNNDLEDNIGDDIKLLYPEVVFIQSDKNLGMGAGNNLGIKKAKGNFILVLNADTYVNENTIKILYNYLIENNDAGIVGPKLLNPNGSLQYNCFSFPKPYTFLLRRTILGKLGEGHLKKFLMSDFDHNSIKEADWIMGSCLLIRKEIFKKTGEGFDDRFWMYFEDTDLCKRTWQAGYKVVYDPYATAIHDHGRGSATGKWYIAPFKNRLARAHMISWFKYFWKWGIK